MHLAGSGVLLHGMENANIGEWYLLPDSSRQMKLNVRGWADVHLWLTIGRTSGFRPDILSKQRIVTWAACSLHGQMQFEQSDCFDYFMDSLGSYCPGAMDTPATMPNLEDLAVAMTLLYKL